MTGSEDNDLNLTLTGLVGLLPAGETFEDTLNRIVTLACQTVDGCESASVTLLGDDGGDARTVVQTHDLALRLDEVQYRVGSGPCLEAAASGVPVEVPSMGAEKRWARRGSRTRCGRGPSSSARRACSWCGTASGPRLPASC